jgi:PAS domain S-box-containing protein
MPEPTKSNHQPKGQTDLHKRTSGESAELIAELQRVNSEIQQSRRAALNVMEDAILSKEALRLSEEKYRQKLEQEVQERTADLKKANEQIKEQARYIKRITETVPDMISVTNLETREFEYLNKETLKSQGFDPAEMNAKTAEEWMEYVHPGDRQVLADYFEKFATASDNDVFTVEYRAKGSSGRWDWFLVRGRAFQRNETGTVTHVLNVIENITERKKAEQEVLRLKDEIARQAEDKYRTIFNSIDEGFCIIEMIYDEKGQPVDWLYLEANPTFAKQSGFDPVGRKATEVVGNVEKFWFDFYDNVARTGKFARTENKVVQLNRWYSIYASRVGGEGSRQVAVVFDDITKRKRREQHQSLLSDITNKLVSFGDLEETLDRVCERIGKFFGVKQCMLSEITNDFETSIAPYGWHAEDTPSLKGTYKMSDFLSDKQVETHKAGKPLVVTDTQTDPDVSADNYGALGIYSFIIVPLLRNGVWRFEASIIDNKPRQWEDDEINLLQELTNRVWTQVEHARAETELRKGDERKAFLLKLSDALRPLIDPKETQFIAAQLTGEYLDANLVHYVETAGDYVIIQQSWVNGVEPVRGKVRHEAYGKLLIEGLRAGKTQVCNNVITDPTINKDERELLINTKILAYVAVPLIKKGEWVAAFAVHASQSRNWNADETGLIEEVAERTWAAVERARTEEALRESEERFRTLFESIDEGFTIIELIFNEKGKAEDYEFLATNPALKRLTGIKDIVGDRASVVLPNFGQEWLRIFELVYTTGESARFEHQVKETGGWFEIQISRIGESSHLAIVYNNVTERKVREQQKDEFIGIASHELKTPATTIKAYAEFLKEVTEEQGNQEIMELVDKLNAQVDRLTRLIHLLLDTTRIAEGQLKLNREKFDLNRLITRQAEELQHMTDKHRLVVNVHKPAIVIADRERITQVIINLVSNAIKYSPKGGDITIASTLTKEGVQVSVRDKGVGISANMKDKIFDRFYRVPNAQIATFPGMGLGLYITAAIMKQHGGKIWVESEKGKGSTFYFLLPFQKV